jgi:hypothetical protein
VALVAGLGAALDYIAGQAGGDLEKGRIALIDNAQVNAAATRAGAGGAGLHALCAHFSGGGGDGGCGAGGDGFGRRGEGAEGALQPGDANGQGEMQGKIFRVAHLGFFDYLDTIAFLGAMEHIAKDTLGLPVVWAGGGGGAGRCLRRQ